VPTQAAAQFEGSAGEVQVGGERGADLRGGDSVDGCQGDGEPRERGGGLVKQTGQHAGGDRPWDASQVAHGQVASKVAEDQPFALERPEQAAHSDSALAAGSPLQAVQRVLDVVCVDFPKRCHAGRRPRSEDRPQSAQVAANAFPAARLVLPGALAAQRLHPCVDLLGDGLRQRGQHPLDPSQIAVLVQSRIVDE
jgi:hypothetical protein